MTEVIYQRWQKGCADIIIYSTRRQRIPFAVSAHTHVFSTEGTYPQRYGVKLKIRESA
jgi:uncharacterized protein YijF (DUF1287 family)